ncbi:MAG: glutamine amidotransferase family protein, partial [Deltaproteobacteria bacterium]
VKAIPISPLIVRYFISPQKEKLAGDVQGDDFVVNTVMKINSEIDGAYVFSSGKNMGAFKGVGNPCDIAEFFRIEEYEGYIWTAHTRFPTNTPGWWGGAHPFTLLDWSIVHNGEISSYGINKRYLEMYGYRLTLLTDTEVAAYLLDLLIRRHGLSIDVACSVLASPFWKKIDGLGNEDKEFLTALRLTYGSALLNGPFSILFGHSKGLVGLNDRIKLRPLVAAEKGDMVYMASEESAIREICPSPDKVWAPRAGEPVIVNLEE